MCIVYLLFLSQISVTVIKETIFNSVLFVEYKLLKNYIKVTVKFSVYTP
jgi:hypothetical protein